MSTDPWGVDDGFTDVDGGWHETDPEVRRTVHEAMAGSGDGAGPPAGPPIWFVRAGRNEPMWNAATIQLEDGSERSTGHELPADLPLGHHDLHPADGGPPTRLIVVPDRAHLPAGLREWVLNVQLYAACSRRSWGIGDLGDLSTVARFAAEHGARFVGINPLHAPRLVPRPQTSPYYPSSRRWRDPLMIRVDDVPGASQNAFVAEIGDVVRGPPPDRLIDRARVWDAKRAALLDLWRTFGGDADFDAFVARHGEGLDQFAAFCVLDEGHEGPWPTWPADVRRPDGPGVRGLLDREDDAFRFHRWLQWLLDRQLAAAAAPSDVALLGDLAVGFAPDGADSWTDQDLLAPDARIGAPPDEFNPAGQDWGLPPYVPWKLRAARYEPFVRTLRANLEHAGALRIDHVMGLFRLYWQVDNGGAYVRFAGRELLDLVVLESVRAGAIVVGEDLGTVEPGVRDALGQRGVLGTRVLWFEDAPTESWDRDVLATATTHDLPTIAGVASGADAAQREAAGLAVDPETDAAYARHLAPFGPTAPRDGGGGGDRVRTTIDDVHRALAASPAMLAGATLDDLLAVAERPNVPGTTTEIDNWSRSLPRALDVVVDDPVVAASAELLRRPAG